MSGQVGLGAQDAFGGVAVGRDKGQAIGHLYPVTGQHIRTDLGGEGVLAARVGNAATGQGGIVIHRAIPARTVVIGARRGAGQVGGAVTLNPVQKFVKQVLRHGADPRGRIGRQVIARRIGDHVQTAAPDTAFGRHDADEGVDFDAPDIAAEALFDHAVLLHRSGGAQQVQIGHNPPLIHCRIALQFCAARNGR